jgi:uncharacterized protein YbjT (DUF2867 family)
MILVTGATGLSGSLTIREFARQKTPVRALVRDRAKARELEALPTVEIVEGDMLRPETLGAALDGVDRALMISSTGPQMVEVQCSFIETAKRAGVRHVVKFSGKESNLGFDQSRFRFTRMHGEIEAYLEQSGLEWTHLRPSQFMQVYLFEAPVIASKGTLVLPLGDETSLAPIDVEDVAKIAVAILRAEVGAHHGRRYEMTGPEGLKMSEIAERIAAATGRAVSFLSIAPEEHRRRLLAAGIPQFRADAFEEQARERRRCPRAGVDLTTHNQLGVHPTTFAEFARRNAAIFRGESH